VWHASFIRLMDLRDKSFSCVRHDSFICVTCLICMCAMTHAQVEPVTRGNRYGLILWARSVAGVRQVCVCVREREGEGVCVCVRGRERVYVRGWVRPY